MAKTENKATGTPKQETKKSTQKQVNEFIKAQGSEGTTALGIATHLKLVNDDMDKETKAKALKKVRVLARKATGGAAQSRDGRAAIYSMDSK